MQTTITLGHAPAVRASRALTSIDVRKACIRTISIIRRNAVTLAVMSAVALYAGIALGSELFTCSAAFAALGFVRLALQTEKGGEL